MFFNTCYCVIDLYSKYEWVAPLKDKTSITTANAFQKTLDETNHKPNKIWVDKGSEFYDRSDEIMVTRPYIEMYSSHNEEKYIVVERFTRILTRKM